MATNVRCCVRTCVGKKQTPAIRARPAQRRAEIARCGPLLRQTHTSSGMATSCGPLYSQQTTPPLSTQPGKETYHLPTLHPSGFRFPSPWRILRLASTALRQKGSRRTICRQNLRLHLSVASFLAGRISVCISLWPIFFLVFLIGEIGGKWNHAVACVGYK